MSVRLDTVERAVIGSIVAAGYVGIWAPSEYPRRDLGATVVSARLVRGPTARGRTTGYSAEATALTLTISGAAEAQRVGWSIGGVKRMVDVGAEDTDEDVRDALLAAAVVGTGEDAWHPGVTIEALSTNKITFAGAAGTMWNPRALGASASFAVDASTDCQIQTGVQSAVVELQAYASRGTAAAAVLGDIAGQLSMDELIAVRSDLGVTFQGPMSEPVDLSKMAGAQWDSRAAARLRVSLRSYAAKAINTIDSMEFNGTTDLGVAIEVSV